MYKGCVYLVAIGQLFCRLFPLKEQSSWFGKYSDYKGHLSWSIGDLTKMNNFWFLCDVIIFQNKNYPCKALEKVIAQDLAN